MGRLVKVKEYDSGWTPCDKLCKYGGCESGDSACGGYHGGLYGEVTPGPKFIACSEKFDEGIDKMTIEELRKYVRELEEVGFNLATYPVGDL